MVAMKQDRGEEKHLCLSFLANCEHFGTMMGNSDGSDPQCPNLSAVF